MDRISEFFILLAILISFWTDKLWGILDMKLIIFLSLIGSIMISYSRARAEILMKGDYDLGLMARSERLFYLFITMIIAYFIGYAILFIFIFMVLVWSTAIFRLIKIYRILRKEN